MKIAFLVGDLATEQPDYTTGRLAMAAAETGHEVFYIDLDGVSYLPDDSLRAAVRRVQMTTEVSPDTFLEQVQEQETEQLPVAELDVLMLRHEPELAVVERPWTQTIGVMFGEMAARRGVVVLNDPLGFARAISKLYLQEFPPEVRPKTLITRSVDEAKAFIEKQGGQAILKPLQSGKGEGVFLVRPDDDANVNQMIEAVKRDGYVVVQEFLEEAEEGDIRVLMMNGRLLEVDGTIAAVHRTPPPDDIRSNISTGGEAGRVKIDDRIIAIAEAVRPKLVRDGMFFVGLDIAGGKVLEINGTSPGTVTNTHWTTGVDFAPVIVDAIEKKVARAGRNGLTNAELATL